MRMNAAKMCVWLGVVRRVPLAAGDCGGWVRVTVLLFAIAGCGRSTPPGSGPGRSSIMDNTLFMIGVEDGYTVGGQFESSTEHGSRSTSTGEGKYTIAKHDNSDVVVADVLELWIAKITRAGYMVHHERNDPEAGRIGYIGFGFEGSIAYRVTSHESAPGAITIAFDITESSAR